MECFGRVCKGDGMKKLVPCLVCALAVLAFLTPAAWASAGSGGGLPYEDWLGKLQDSATGPVAFAFGLIGIVVAGGILIFGGDLSGFFRTMCVIVLVMALLVTANKIMSDLFGKGATIYSQRYMAQIEPVGRGVCL